ncbi:lipid II:glycine glycyltransferase FemX [Galbibacter pacificus]|uniref:Peptidoglycan bridge formation glycyltransferase FemA/FemB family protein n=1 Tax=Galbibacter pacificus TaxID=2996052 RepID=A0ABT6FU12_9FLAO|nr:peptidoglycan bridge formation glycyltransferase FemA/FemB family protein [Galbibacter pacificus]MDG3583277.1 peptidoglycan bridge formation glycyltransferase FemA/FemB family protein [Galbibacter pacificus]MDG3586758.1 peptidoglycan bridge formation glycyltransferase FemA/FemB family protein [Galbibacter pacificus]
MLCKAEKKEVDCINPTNILPQTPYWGRIKNEQGYIPNGFEITVSKELLGETSGNLGTIQDDLLVLIKYINSELCYAYVPYGPKIEPTFENQGVFLEELSEALKPSLPLNCVFIRYDLLWKNQWANEDEYFDGSGNWNGPPQSRVQEFRVNYKTSHWNLYKSPSDILPKNTFFLDLAQAEDNLLYNMRYNTRYNIKRAKKKGIQVKEYGVEHISQWYKLYYETAKRHQMPLQNEDYFARLLNNQDNYAKGVNVKMLMADYDGQFLASMFLVLSHRRASYLYGASLPNNKMASYALQWESIKLAKQWGCTEYDMFGSAPNLNDSHPLRGVHIYKKGFGGNLFHRMGCWDYPYRKKEYDFFRLQEISN